MTDSVPDSVQTIEESAAALKRLRPAYGDLLDFYKQVFVAQETAGQGVDPAAVVVGEETLAMRAKQGLPLINRSEFVVDEKASHRLLRELSRIAAGSNETLAGAGGRLLAALDTESFRPAQLINAFLNGDAEGLEGRARELRLEPDLLSFFIYHSIKPSLAASAIQLSKRIPPTDVRSNGLCPICGSQPALSVFENDGQRHVHCGFCGLKRRAKRLGCAFCGNDEQASLGYFSVEAEPEYRVDTCQACRNYIKTVDARKLDRPLVVELEQVCTLHLDIKAEEMGYSHPMPHP